MQLIRLGLDGLVRTGLDIEIGESDRRDLEITCVTGYRHIFDRLASTDTGGRGLDVHLYFRIVDIEIVRENHFRILHQLHVSVTRDFHLYGYSLVCLDVVRADISRHGERTYGTGERSGLTGGQRLHVDSNRRSGQHLAHIPIRVEKTIEDATAARLLHTDTHHGIILSTFDRDLTGTLGIQDHLTHYGRLVVTPVVVFQGQLFLLRQLNLLYQETLELRVFQSRNREIFQGIDLESHQETFLLEHASFGYVHLHEQPIVRDRPARRRCLRLLLTRLISRKHLDGQAIRCIIRAVHLDRCRSDIKRTFLLRHQDIRIRNGCLAGTLPVHPATAIGGGLGGTH